ETERGKTRTADPEERLRGRFKPLTPGKTGDLTSERQKAKAGKIRNSVLPEAVLDAEDGEAGISGKDTVPKLKVSEQLNRTGRRSRLEVLNDTRPAFPVSDGKEFSKIVYNGELRPPEDSYGRFWPVFIMLSIVLAAGVGFLYYTDEGRRILYSYVLMEPHHIAKDLRSFREHSESLSKYDSVNFGRHGRRSGRYSQKEMHSEIGPASSEKPLIAVVPPDSAPGSLKDNAKLGQDSDTGKTDKPDKPAGEAISSVKAPRPVISNPAESAPEKTEIAVIPAAPVTAGTSGESAPPVIAPRPIISIPAEILPEKTEIASGPEGTNTAGASGESAPLVIAPRPIISQPAEAAPLKKETAGRSQVPDNAGTMGESVPSVTAPRPIISKSAEISQNNTETGAEIADTDLSGKASSLVTAPRPIISSPDTPVSIPDDHAVEQASVPQKTQENKNTTGGASKKTTDKRSGTSSQKNSGSNAAQGRKAAGTPAVNTGKKSNKPNYSRRNPRQRNGGKKK
ncbi:hypothetical protein, partial [Succinimonas sp.]|uniref:hypothetical protein n=1 Tax=Succinimonas sp. TaxID=1936151 RepID=UPI003870BE1B